MRPVAAAAVRTTLMLLMGLSFKNWENHKQQQQWQQQYIEGGNCYNKCCVIEVGVAVMHYTLKTQTVENV